MGDRTRTTNTQARRLGLGIGLLCTVSQTTVYGPPILNDSDYVYMQGNGTTPPPRVHRYGRDQIWFMNIHIGWCYAAMCSTFGCQNHAPSSRHVTSRHDSTLSTCRARGDVTWRARWNLALVSFCRPGCNEVVWYTRAVRHRRRAAAADRMSVSRRRRFRDVFTSCCTPAICC